MLLDHVEPITLALEAEQRYANELQSLRILRAGMARLYQVVLGPETQAAAEFPKRFIAGPAPFADKFDMDLIACCFNWYALSACSYAQIVGSIRSEAFPGTPPARQYVREVLPAVKGWRDCLAEHPARMGGIDAEGLRIAAVFAPVGFMAGRFITAPSRGKNDPKLSPWSLTHVHEQLIPRYWPDPSQSQS